MKKLEIEQMTNIEGGSVKACAIGAGVLRLAALGFAPLAGTAALFALGCALYAY